ncbi:hypothetical protein JTB14_038374 [Gonioctena quinquepunctata]|nr:hypothetical protein JTB14_038374 [Gonioctena quinquepunctata]
MDYGAIAYNSCRPSRLKQLDNLQLTALRLATGAFRTSPAVAVQCDSTILPLDLRRDLQTQPKFYLSHSILTTPAFHPPMSMLPDQRQLDQLEFVFMKPAENTLQRVSPF